jgi:TolB-like protein/DNA-binding winged helix-turn-helix (wHTH) protein
VHLQQQPAKVLELLLRRAGELVTRDEIRAAVWGQDTFVNFDQGLNFCIKEIRAALGDDADEPRYVETLPRRGYRFIAPVEAFHARPLPPPEPASAKTPPRRLAVAASLLTPAALLAVLLAWLAWPARPRRAASPARVTIAVLPFENLSGDAAQDPLADGLTDELTALLGRLAPQRLSVIARNGLMPYKGRERALERIGGELGADYVVEGAIRRGHERVRVTASLIKVGDRTQLFSEAYERQDQDRQALQREVAQRLAGRIEAALTREPR